MSCIKTWVRSGEYPKHISYMTAGRFWEPLLGYSPWVPNNSPLIVDIQIKHDIPTKPIEARNLKALELSAGKDEAFKEGQRTNFRQGELASSEVGPLQVVLVWVKSNEAKGCKGYVWSNEQCGYLVFSESSWHKIHLHILLLDMFCRPVLLKTPLGWSS